MCLQKFNKGTLLNNSDRQIEIYCFVRCRKIELMMWVLEQEI